MRPMSVDGLPVGGARVIIPITFAPGASGARPESVIHVLSGAPWSAAPTLDQMNAAFPKRAMGKAQSGHVILRCGLNGDRLGGCDKIGETPSGLGFEHAALSLVKDFKVITNPKADRYGEFRIDVPFDFRDPSLGPQQVEVHNPVWLRRIDPNAALKLYPEAALKAGYRSGSATLTCTVVHDGSLTGCQTELEEPAGMGFGDAALQIAAVMQMNPWTSQGAPVDGMKIRLPIKLVAAADAKADPVPVPPPK
jgi:hypothetical protein